MIKIVYITGGAVMYGANRALLNMLDGIINFGVCPLVIISGKGELCEELERRYIPYKVIRHRVSIYPELSNKQLTSYALFIPRLLVVLLRNFIATKALVKNACEFGADMIHTNIGMLHIGYQASRVLGIPHVWHIREYQDLDFSRHPIPSKAGFIRKLRFFNNHLIAISYGIFNHFKMQNNACVIYDGVMKKSQSQFVTLKGKYFLFVGRLQDAKGIRQLIAAFIEFAKYNNDYELRIAGDGKEAFEAELYRMVENSGFSLRIHFLGFRRDIYDLMAKATALIVSSRCEGLGFITVEAMFNGCLVIGKNSGGTKEILEKEHLGILYSEQDELVSAMKAVVTNGIETYFPIIKKAQERAIALYSQEQHVTAVYKYYKDILREKIRKKVIGIE